jgi:hypothetical protein
MGDRNDLDALRAAFPACLVLAYADLSTTMILAASARTPQPREDLDALAREAGAALADGGTVAARLTSLDTRLYLRAEPDAAEAYCCVFPASVTPSEILGALRAGLLTEGAGA